MSLWATKSVAALRAEADATGERSLKRTLGALNLTMLGIGAIIGAGIFVLTGLAAALHAGPAVPLSFVVAAIACGLAGLCYAEMASAVPVAGSAYTYSYATMGEFVAWIIGWDLVLEYAMGAATVGVGWSGYFVSMLDYFGIHIPAALTSAPLRFCTAPDVANAVTACIHPGWNPTGSLVNLPAMLIVLLATTVLVIGIEESAKVNNLIVILKLAVVLLFVLFGFRYVNPENWHPFIPPNTGTFGEFGWSGVFRGAGLIFFAYIGFDAVSTAAQEARNPQKDMPIGILGLARHLHGTLHRRLAHADRPGPVRPPQRGPPGGIRGRADPGAQLAPAAHHDRRGPRPRLGGAGHASGPEPGVLLDVARRAHRARGPARSIPGSGRRTSPPSTSASSSPSSPAPSRSRSSASWSTSARCWHSCSCAPAS